jgi:hypothetical protein
MLHAIKSNYSFEKLEKAAEKLREAKLSIFKSEFSEKSVLPKSLYVPGTQAQEWESLSVEVIVENYRKLQHIKRKI